ncbi:hypothetical protein F8M41_017753 [Gigaspora margarita]|uniref:Uncharacterized protein n=1 Tax=Gigaspora margarita TaxID=4874 RepID=A0A8H4ELX2_GIGMA|nr:hypothetical protein F8M41_017753 [Gigaspora margarita]
MLETREVQGELRLPSDISRTIPPSQQSELISNGYITPSPRNLTLNNSLVEPPMFVDRINHPFFDEDEVDDVFIIDDVDDLCFMGGNLILVLLKARQGSQKEELNNQIL